MNMFTTRETIEQRLNELANAVQGMQEIDALYLFGSQASQTANKLSDIDLAVLLRKDAPMVQYFDYRRAYGVKFSDILKMERVDVIILNEASILLAHEVLSARKILFERDPAHRVEFEVHAVDAYLDFKPLMEVRRQYTQQQLDQGVFFG